MSRREEQSLLNGQRINGGGATIVPSKLLFKRSWIRKFASLVSRSLNDFQRGRFYFFCRRLSSLEILILNGFKSG